YASAHSSLRPSDDSTACNPRIFRPAKLQTRCATGRNRGSESPSQNVHEFVPVSLAARDPRPSRREIRWGCAASSQQSREHHAPLGRAALAGLPPPSPTQTSSWPSLLDFHASRIPRKNDRPHWTGAVSIWPGIESPCLA